MEKTECSSLGCHSLAVAKSRTSGMPLCNLCALRISYQFGVEVIETIPGEKFPWDRESDIVCPLCGVKYNGYTVAHTGGCPSCKRIPK